MCKYPIVLFLNFSRCFLRSFPMRPGQVFRKPCLIAFRILAVVELKSAACKYLSSCGFDVYARMLFTTFYDFCGPRGTSHIPIFWFLVPFYYLFSIFIDEHWYCCLVWCCIHHHKTPDDINAAVCIFWGMRICLASLIRPGSWSVAICVDYIVLSSISLAFISLSIITGAIVGVACLSKCIFATDSEIARMLVIVGWGGLSIWFIELILWLLIWILLYIAPNRHSHLFSLPPILFL